MLPVRQMFFLGAAPCLLVGALSCTLPARADGPVDAGAPRAASGPESLLNLNTSANRETDNDEFVVAGVVERSDRTSASAQASVNAVLQRIARDAREAGLTCDSGRYESTRIEDPVRPGSTSPPGAHWLTRGTLLLRTTDLPLLERFLGRAGADLAIDNIQSGLRTATRERVLAELRTEAIARFRQRAQESAVAFGYRGWAIAQVSLQEDDGQRPSYGQGLQGAPMARLAAVSADAPPPLTEGRTRVSVQVHGSIRLLDPWPRP